MAIQPRAWFFTITATATKLGLRFRKEDRPEQQTFENLTESTLFKAETDDRAKEDTGGDPTTIVGHVVASTDAQAKANEAKAIDRTRVVQPSQLPTVEGENQDLTDWGITGTQLVEVADGGAPTRNQWIVRFQAGFLAALNSIFPRLIPSGGTAGQALTKIDGDDYNVEWSDVGSTDELVKISANDTTPGVLLDKLQTSPTIQVVENNDGSNENITLEVIPASGLQTLYVDGNNSNPGQGSVVDPFQTIQRTLDRLDNSGDFTDTVTYPPITAATVTVAGYSGVNYNIANNIARSAIDWNFLPGAIVNYTGADFLFDCTGLTQRFSVFGAGEFTSATGKILHVTGGDGANAGVNEAIDDFIFTNIDCDANLPGQAAILIESIRSTAKMNFGSPSGRAFVRCEHMMPLRINSGRGSFTNITFSLQEPAAAACVYLDNVERSASFRQCNFSRAEAGGRNVLLTTDHTPGSNGQGGFQTNSDTTEFINCTFSSTDVNTVYAVEASSTYAVRDDIEGGFNRGATVFRDNFFRSDWTTNIMFANTAFPDHTLGGVETTIYTNGNNSDSGNDGANANWLLGMETMPTI